MQLVSQRVGHVTDGVAHDCDAVAAARHAEAVSALMRGADEIARGQYAGGTVGLYLTTEHGYALQIDNMRARAQAVWVSWDHEALIEAYVRFARELR